MRLDAERIGEPQANQRPQSAKLDPRFKKPGKIDPARTATRPRRREANRETAGQCREDRHVEFASQLAAQLHHGRPWTWIPRGMSMMSRHVDTM